MLISIRNLDLGRLQKNIKTGHLCNTAPGALQKKAIRSTQFMLHLVDENMFNLFVICCTY